MVKSPRLYFEFRFSCRSFGVFLEGECIGLLGVKLVVWRHSTLRRGWSSPYGNLKIYLVPGSHALLRFGLLRLHWPWAVEAPSSLRSREEESACVDERAGHAAFSALAAGECDTVQATAPSWLDRQDRFKSTFWDPAEVNSGSRKSGWQLESPDSLLPNWCTRSHPQGKRNRFPFVWIEEDLVQRRRVSFGPPRPHRGSYPNEGLEQQNSNHRGNRKLSVITWVVKSAHEKLVQQNLSAWKFLPIWWLRCAAWFQSGAIPHVHWRCTEVRISMFSNFDVKFGVRNVNHD